MGLSPQRYRSEALHHMNGEEENQGASRHTPGTLPPAGEVRFRAGVAITASDKKHFNHTRQA